MCKSVMTKRLVEVREAVDADLPDIISMWRRNIKTVDTASDIVTLYRYFREYFLVATHAGMGNNTGANCAVIGFMAGAVRDGHGHISGIAVDKEYRRNSVGKQLLEAADAKFRANGFHRVTLEVRISNTGAMGFYKAQGYKSICTISGYYADGEDAIVYELKI